MKTFVVRIFREIKDFIGYARRSLFFRGMIEADCFLLIGYGAAKILQNNLSEPIPFILLSVIWAFGAIRYAYWVWIDKKKDC